MLTFNNIMMLTLQDEAKLIIYDMLEFKGDCIGNYTLKQARLKLVELLRLGMKEEEFAMLLSDCEWNFEKAIEIADRRYTVNEKND